MLYFVRKRTSLSGPVPDARYDGREHWIISTELDMAGKPKRRNCKLCALEKKPDSKTLLMCEKCLVPLHTHCFKEGFMNFFMVFFSQHQVRLDWLFWIALP
jgi:hypothetical protein